MFQFSARGDSLYFEFPEGQIDFNEVLQAVGQATRISLRDGRPVVVTIKGVDSPGRIEARHTTGRIYPPINTAATNIWYIPASSPSGYDLYVSPLASPLYVISIPGVMQSIDQHILAVAPEFFADQHLMLWLIFNTVPEAVNVVASRQLMPPDWRIFPEDYTNIRSVRDMLAKKPRVVKPVDFGPILVKLFGEKIAAAILKEIK